MYKRWIRLITQEAFSKKLPSTISISLILDRVKKYGIFNWGEESERGNVAKKSIFNLHVKKDARVYSPFRLIRSKVIARAVSAAGRL